MKSTLLISVCGLDASGKSTLVDRLMKHLKNQEIPFKKCSMFPQGHLREAILSDGPVSPIQELLITKALHLQAYEDIEKAFDEVPIVLLDRCYACAYAYQGFGSELLNELERLDRIAPPRLEPDIIFFLDTPIEVCEERMRIRNEDKDQMELRNREFIRRVKAGYDLQVQNDEAKYIAGVTNRKQFYRIDGTLSPAEIALEAQLHLDYFLESYFDIE